MKINTKNVSDATQKMASGKRIVGAKDDAAGLVISQKMKSQIRGLRRAYANALDGISMVQTAEGALQETQSALLRMRELTVQAASDTNVTADRDAIQKEIGTLASEVNRIANTTEFNTKKILQGGNGAGSSAAGELTDEQQIVSNLKKWWLSEAEKIVKNSFGIEAPNINMEVKIFDDPNNNAAAFVKASYASVPGDTVGQLNITGKGAGLTLEINLAHAKPVDASLSGGEYYQYVDRVITHEITHAVMSTTMNFGDLPIWFIEGSAEFSHGADERLKNNIATINSPAIIDAAALDAGVASVVAGIGTGTEADWNGGAPPSYSSAYLAVRYLDHQIRDNGGNGIRDLTTYLAANDTDTLDDALANASSATFANTADWITNFKTDVTNMATMTAETGIVLDTAIVGGKFVAEVDTGSVLGFDATGGVGNKYTAESIVPDGLALTGKESEQPMDGFNLTWPSDSSLAESGSGAANKDSNVFSLQIGANEYQSMDVYFNDMQSKSIGITGESGGYANTESGAQVKFVSDEVYGVTNGTGTGIETYAFDVMDSDNATLAIELIDEAIKKVTSEMSRLGAYTNRLEHTVKNLSVSEENMQASESRIADADLAKISTSFAKENVRRQAIQAMLAQSNQRPEAVLQLLR